MARNATKKQLRDQALRAQWALKPDAEFASFNLTRARVEAAQAALQGYIVLPGDPAYNNDRMLFNPAFNPFPMMIIYCVVETDVAIALAMARETVLPFTVRSGGHCTAGFSAGSGVLIDVSQLDDIAVDASSQVATVGCGVPFKKLYTALQPYGLHVPAGECDDVCVGGYVQGGGYGFTSVTYGMNCDNVIDMRVMLADGGIVTASQSVNSDLWWAMRGGTGGNFGVLLSVRYQLRPLGNVFGWAIIWPLQTEQEMVNATLTLMYLQANYLGASTNPLLNIQVSFCFQPGIEPGLPPGSPTQPYMMIRGLYVGDASSGLAAIGPLRSVPGAITQWTEEADFVTLNGDLLNVPYSMPYFPSDSVMPREDKVSRYVDQPLAPAQWRALLDYFKTSPNPYSYGYLECYGGAIASYPYEQSAFIHRKVLFNAVLDVFWFDSAQKAASEQFLQGWKDLIGPMSNGHIYQNYPQREQPDYAWAYWGDAQAGLYAVKCKYDPNMAFRFAQQVRPLMRPGGGPGPVIFLPPALQQAVDQPIVYSTLPRAAAQ